jgi:hypothetical protein
MRFGGEKMKCIVGIIGNKNTLRGRNAEVLNVKAGDMCVCVCVCVYSDHFALRLVLLT